MEIRDTIQRLKAELPSGVRLAAVSKFHPVSAIKEAYSAGQRIFAESRPQELYSKVCELSKETDTSGEILFGDIEWHFIGHLQTNKLKLVLPYVSMVQSVDSVHLLDAIDRWGRENNRETDVLLECHIASEQTKQGFSADEIHNVIAASGRYGNVRFRGLRGMATFTDDETVIRSDFSRIYELFNEISRAVSNDSSLSRLKDFTELSIGMSEDYRIALEYGSTMVRIGTMIFGPREY